MNYEVRISKHFLGEAFNVDLISWQRGEGVAHGRAFNVSKKEAEKVAAKTAAIYDAEITRKIS